MNKSDIGLNAGKIWRLLSNYAKWDYGTLKRKSGLKDKELGAALGWLACEDKIVLHQEDGELYIFLGVDMMRDFASGHEREYWDMVHEMISVDEENDKESNE